MERLDGTFAALADGTRRDILERLSRGSSRVTDLARPYEMSLNAVSKHVQVLERAGLVVRTRKGREHRIRVNPEPIQAAREWIDLYAESWRRQFEALDEYLQRIQRDGPNKDRESRRKSGAPGSRRRPTR